MNRLGQCVNQCDGCRRGLPTRMSKHGSIMHDGEDGMPVMICTAKRHHVWCNFQHRPAETCEMCKRLNELYPEDGMGSVELAAKYFPNAIPRT